eukprot:719866-Amphidinium_carterae.5
MVGILIGLIRALLKAFFRGTTLDKVANWAMCEGKVPKINASATQRIPRRLPHPATTTGAEKSQSQGLVHLTRLSNLVRGSRGRARGQIRDLIGDKHLQPSASMNKIEIGTRSTHSGVWFASPLGVAVLGVRQRPHGSRGADEKKIGGHPHGGRHLFRVSFSNR